MVSSLTASDWPFLEDMDTPMRAADTDTLTRGTDRNTPMRGTDMDTPMARTDMNNPMRGTDMVILITVVTDTPIVLAADLRSTEVELENPTTKTITSYANCEMNALLKECSTVALEMSPT